MVYKFFDKKSAGRGVNMQANNKRPLDLAEELHKPLLENLKEEQFIQDLNNIWAADLADMQLMSMFNKRFRFLLCVVDIFSKYAWVVPLKDKKGITITDAFQKILDDSDRKPNKIWLIKEANFKKFFLKMVKR